ncbi:hypothetical protein CYMTET_35242 [Cymbomonas tetramitiformis]|uniref:Reverse transcriptase Ty1/copia-type domain-containing protein n=1 Tax=Cymbomonas tetramitiformis TaxID=36881 RepID=A0AAE0F9P2_9CHLO|nr:hypothetical protein CYMTET_35242 [Cymbomonas tetramitiformis]
MGVVTCFLNRMLDLDAPIYVRWPDEREVRGICFGRLAHIVYGIKQAPMNWYCTMRKWLVKYDDCPAVSNIDPCLFFMFIAGDVRIVYVYIHVDNSRVLTSSVDWKVQCFADFQSVLLER